MRTKSQLSWLNLPHVLILFHWTKLCFLHFTIILLLLYFASASSLCLLDLSAAFDTTDHAVLLDCLISLWLGIHGTALVHWFKSYFSDHLFCVMCSHDLSEPLESFCGVLRSTLSSWMPYFFTVRLHVMQRTVLLSQFCPSVCLSVECVYYSVYSPRR